MLRAMWDWGRDSEWSRIDNLVGVAVAVGGVEISGSSGAVVLGDEVAEHHWELGFSARLSPSVT